MDRKMQETGENLKPTVRKFGLFSNRKSARDRGMGGNMNR